MNWFDTGDTQLHWREDGDPNGAPVLFSNSLGTDLRLWDYVLDHMPKTGLRYIRYDTRGHGLSAGPDGPYSMGALITEAERLMDHLEAKDAVVVGLSMGGLIAQGLAVKRLDLVRGLVLSNTGAKIGNDAMWAERIATVEEHGIEALADATLERWFSNGFKENPELHMWRNMLTRQSPKGFNACMSAISRSDMISATSGLRLPALGIAGAEDGSTPPDMVRELMGLIPGSGFELIRKAGHLPCVEQPEIYAKHLIRFMDSIGHSKDG
ncbi:3-oxoadipate enol-lactonase [Planktotalea sp.]|uniref:3-oxoadipate enol-lactonase n=1 Tax=Planktotalea sp. TaxID=2029877 RepID=UPI0032978D45